jgi:hypothetical protein
MANCTHGPMLFHFLRLVGWKQFLHKPILPLRKTKEILYVGKDQHPSRYKKVICLLSEKWFLKCLPTCSTGNLNLFTVQTAMAFWIDTNQLDDNISFHTYWLGVKTHYCCTLRCTPMQWTKSSPPPF